MPRWLTIGCAVTALLTSMVTGALARVVNARPATIPALRVWHGASGYFSLSQRSRIVVADRSLLATARLLRGELYTLTGRRIGVATGGAAAAQGDVVLRRTRARKQLGPEGYELHIGRAVTLSAPSVTGVFYGTRTLLQLLAGGRRVPQGTAQDWPRYPDRGLMIDLGRRVYPAGWIESEIRQMAYLKLNILHLHLTDDQRWGIASSPHPEVVSPHALTKPEVRQILKTAARYHVVVVPEIDMPGHFGAFLAKHPELELRIEKQVQPPPNPASGKLDITNPRALAVVRQLLREYLPLFPGRYWDVGADEYLTPAEEPLYPQLLAYARAHYGPKATTKDAILGFVNWVDRIVRAHGKTLWAWHDELGKGSPTSPLTANADIIAGWWINFSPLSEPQPPTPEQLLAAGHSIINEGWFPTYYTESIGPIEGKPDMKTAYESWDVNRFCGPTVAGKMAPCYAISPGERRNLGSTINAWDNHELTLAQIAQGLAPPLRVIAQKTWNSPELTPSYAVFQQIMQRVGRAP